MSAQALTTLPFNPLPAKWSFIHDFLFSIYMYIGCFLDCNIMNLFIFRFKFYLLFLRSSKKNFSGHTPRIKDSSNKLDMPLKMKTNFFMCCMMQNSAHSPHIIQTRDQTVHIQTATRIQIGKYIFKKFHNNPPPTHQLSNRKEVQIISPLKSARIKQKSSLVPG